MKSCPYCGYSNYEYARVCRKCEVQLAPTAGTVFQPKQKPTFAVGPVQARRLRNRGLVLIVLGLLMKVYWGGYGPWPPIDSPKLVAFRTWADPLLFVGGATLYLLGWILRRV